MAGKASFDDEDVISDINVTPLVDVVLVLLVIFMITAPVLYQSAIKVQLPKAQTGESIQEGPIQFTISKNEEISWSGQLVSWEEIEARLKKLDQDTGTLNKEQALISADQTTPHGTVVRLMDLLRKHGLTRFGLNVDHQ